MPPTAERLPDRSSLHPQPRWPWVAVSALAFGASVVLTTLGVRAGLAEMVPVYGKPRPDAPYLAVRAFWGWQLAALPLAALAIVVAARGGRTRFLPLAYGLLALGALAYLTMKLLVG